jgi:DNA-binding transcriptional MerR regulator
MRGEAMRGEAMRGGAMREEPVRQFFSIGDVCTLTELKPHVLRYWETQFKFLSPAKNRSGNRVYQRREVELILLVKHLLYTEKYTIEGARRKVDEHRKAGAIRGVSRVALDRETLESMERELATLVHTLAGPGAKPDPGSR